MRNDIEASIKDSGLHLKTFVGYNYSLDTTDAPVLPTKGIRASLKTQFAGLIGNIGLIKGEASISAAHHLLNGIVCLFNDSSSRLWCPRSRQGWHYRYPAQSKFGSMINSFLVEALLFEDMGTIRWDRVNRQTLLLAVMHIMRADVV